MYEDTLDIALTVTISGTATAIPGGNVRELGLEYHAWGLTGRAVFMVSSEKEQDQLLSSFTGQDLIEVSLTVAPHYVPKGKQATVLKASGLVTRKSIVLERSIEDMALGSQPILYRLYRIEFADAAQVLWRQHCPYDLLVGKTMKDLFDAHKGSKVTLTYDWDALQTQYPIIALPLGFDAGEASFYDFVMWYVDTNNGVLTYDSQANSYKMTKAKSAEGQPTVVDSSLVSEFRSEFPETPRCTGNVLNGYSEDPQTKALTNSQAVDGVHRDFLARYPVSSDFQNRQQLEQARLQVRQTELGLDFRNTPLVPPVPGSLIKLEGGLWNSKIFPYSKAYRVRDMAFRAEALNSEPTADHNLGFTRFGITLGLLAETQAETWVSLPAYRPPTYPVLVEGKILSEQGADTDQTFQIYQDQNTSQNQYKIKIPLWSNAQVVAPFDPVLSPGHFYFPAYRDARVLVALGLHSATIDRFLDWRSGAQLSMDSQGNKLLMGKTDKSQTFMSHTYVDNKPVLNVQRTSDSDLQTVTLQEGCLILETKQNQEGS